MRDDARDFSADLVPIAESASVIEHLAPLAHLLARPGVTELCINRPDEAYLLTEGQWSVHEVRFSYEAAREFATSVATLTGQYTDESAPLLSASLPQERIQFVLPSAVPTGTVGIGIRKPDSAGAPPVDAYDEMFAQIEPPSPGALQSFENRLLEMKEARQWRAFFTLAVLRHQTIVVAGKTGSGKTRFMKWLASLIPADERLITIEDNDELRLPGHANKLRLFYSKGGQGGSSITAKDLLEASLRLLPDRILLAECRSGEAYYFMRNAASGHPGSMTSIHAGRGQAFEQLALMVRESAAGGGMTMSEIKQLARDVVDIVVYFHNGPQGRQITDVYYDPERKAA